MTASATPLLSRSDASWLTEWRRTLDWGLVAGVFVLMGVGLLMALAAGPSAAARFNYSDPYFFVYRQAGFVAIGAVVLLMTSLLDARWARRFSALVFCVGLASLLFVLLSGHEVNGAQRWIRFPGFSVQPSEFVKPVVILLSGWLLAQREAFPKGPWTIIAFVLYAVTLGLFLLQPDVDQSVLLTAAFVATFYVSGLPARWIAIFALGGAALAVLLYSLIGYVRVRIKTLIDPSAVDTYQIDRAIEAIGRGGLFGTGPGEGLVKARLPDAHSDFIFSVMAEEFGLIAVVALIGVYALITVRGFRAASRVKDAYARASAAGLFSLFALQAFMNIGVNLAVLPPTGLTLPFVSYGGSSMISMGLTLGLALALVRGEGTRIRGRYA